VNLEFFFKTLGEIWLVGEVLIAILTYTRQGKGKISDRGTQILLWIAIVGSSLIDGWMHKFFPSDMPGRDSWLLPVALGILILGLVIRAVAIITLGKAFSANVAMREGQKLQRRGLYRLVRHPSYLGLELILLAYALHTRTWACFAVFFVPTTLALLYRIHVEEIALRNAFGAEYEDYSHTTKRLIPGIY
jgi:protein-S-isoprenylcysteine O-methyltransferase Ste14